MDQCQAPHREEPAPGDGNDDEQQVPPTAQRHEEQCQDERHSQYHRHHTVGLDLLGITHSYQRTTRQVYLYLSMGCFHLTGHIVQQGCQLCVMLGLTGTIRGVHHHHSPLHVG